MVFYSSHVLRIKLLFPRNFPSQKSKRSSDIQPIARYRRGKQERIIYLYLLSQLSWPSRDDFHPSVCLWCLQNYENTSCLHISLLEYWLVSVYWCTSFCLPLSSFDHLWRTQNCEIVWVYLNHCGGLTAWQRMIYLQLSVLSVHSQTCFFFPQLSHPTVPSTL